MKNKLLLISLLALLSIFIAGEIFAKTTLITDNFDDAAIDNSLWDVHGSSVYESGGFLNLQTEVTDAGGNISSKWMDFDPALPIILERDILNHYSNDYYIAKLHFTFEGAPEFTFGVNYANMDYPYLPWVSKFGIYLFRNGRSGHNSTAVVDHSPTISAIWDQWFHEKIIYDPVTGLLSYYLNDSLLIEYDVGMMPVLPSYRMQIYLAPWSWYTGGYQYVDNIEIIQNGAGTSDPLITSFTATPLIGIAPLPVNFICTATDPDGGSITEYRLDINNDGVIDYITGNSNFSYTFTNPGDYQVKCTVVDDESETATSSLIYISVNQSGGAYTNGNYNYYIPYFRSGSGYWSGVGVSNSSKVNTSPLSITVYGCDGSVLATEYPNSLPVNGQIAQAVAGTLEATGWILVNSHEELTGLSFFARSYMADVPFVDTVSKALMIPHIAQNEMWDTHLLICNPNTTPVGIILTAYDQNGNVVATNSSSLPAWGSDTYPLADTFSGLPALTGKVKVTVIQGDGVAAFALYMNQKSGGSYFAGINAVDISAPVVVTPF